MQADGGQQQDREGLVALLLRRVRAGRHDARTVPAGGWNDITRSPAASKSKVTLEGAAIGPGGTRREHVLEVLGVLDDADDPQRPPVRRPRRADLQVEQGGEGVVTAVWRARRVAARRPGAAWAR